MGSKFSRAVRPHVNADVSVAPASPHHDIDITNERFCQNLAPRLFVRNQKTTLLSHDDIDIATSTTRTANSQRQRAMSFTAAVSVENRQQLLNTFEQFYAEHQFRAIDYDIGEAQTLSATPPPILQPAEPVPQCIICCKDLPEEKDMSYVKEAMKPCRSCNSTYCVSCVRDMFVEACRDVSRMPPRCCVPINLHQVKSMLSMEEVAVFRSKYDEWSTPNPMYCPVPVCSAFIPDRLLPHHIRAKDRKRVDSGVGVPSSDTFACPTCDASICGDCRQSAHPGSLCSIHEFGLDAETAELLKKWGYKQCPKCNHGVKRMFGCNHMECRCGAHFCWVCMHDLDDCGRTCYDDNEEDYDTDADPDEDDEDVITESIDSDTRPTVTAQTEEGGPAGVTTQTQPNDDMETTATAHPEAGLQNLDGGGGRYWEATELNFGEEPSNDIQDRSWRCTHTFDTLIIPFAAAFTAHATEIECVKCWSIAHAEVRAPRATMKESTMPIATPAGRARSFGVRGGRGRGRGRAYVPPRGLFRADATIGTAPHLTATIAPMFQGAPTSQDSAMEDVQFTNPTASNVVTPNPFHHASFANSPDHTKQSPSYDTMPSIFATLSHPLSLAHECVYCHIVLCGSCKTDIVAIQDTAETKKRERQDREDEARRVAREEYEYMELWRQHTGPGLVAVTVEAGRNEVAETTEGTVTVTIDAVVENEHSTGTATIDADNAGYSSEDSDYDSGAPQIQYDISYLSD
jgi:hypothetical protein